MDHTLLRAVATPARAVPSTPTPKPAVANDQPTSAIATTPASATANDLFRALVAGDDVAQDEEILLKLVSEEGELLQRLQVIERKLGAQLERALDSPKLSVAVARTLRDTVRISAAVHRRIAGSLETASLLRGRRRLLHRAGVRDDL